MLRILLSLLLLTILPYSLSAKKDPENKRKGTVTVYYPNSKQVWYTGNNKDYKKEGIWLYYTTDGQISKSVQYKAGVLDGERKTFLKDKMITLESFQNGVAHGMQRYYYPNGKLKVILYCTAGNPDSAHYWNSLWYMYSKVELYQNKQIKAIRYYSNNGYVKATEYYENGKKSGTWKKYSGNTNDTVPYSIINYKNDRKNGFSKESSWNGQYSSEVYYLNDTLNGPFRTLDNKKNLLNEGTFKNGKLDGVYKSYHAGDQVEEIHYKHGIATGVAKVYRTTDGKVLSERYFASTVKNGNALVDSVIQYNENGNRVYMEVHKRQSEPGYNYSETIYFTSWFIDGKLQQQGQYTNELKQGKWIEYFPSGKIKSVLNYSAGSLNGKAEFWHSNGQKAMEFIAVNNTVEKKPNVWQMNGKPCTSQQKQYFEIVDQFKPSDVKFIALEEDPPLMVETKTSTEESVSDAVEAPVEMEAPDYLVKQQYLDLNLADLIPGGDSVFAKLAQQNMTYPYIDQAFSQSGVIILSLTLSPEGKVINTFIKSNPTNSGSLENEALRLMYCTSWQNPTKGKVTINIPLRFTPND